MMFSRLNFKRTYRTKKDNVVEDLLIPIISHSKKYDRGTGFFSLDSLASLAEGLIPYVRNGGSIRIVTSVKLGEEEINAISQGEEVAQALQLSKIETLIDEEVTDDEAKVNLDLIVNLLASKRLEIRVGYVEGGLYHEKMGLFEDQEGEKICYIGSANQTYGGFVNNRENIYVLMSWSGDTDSITEQEEYFEQLWNNEDDEVRVFRVKEAVEKKLIEKFAASHSVEEALERFDNSNQESTRQGKKELYEYQKEAIKQFKDNECCHFFEMATGTGKTFTAVRLLP